MTMRIMAGVFLVWAAAARLCRADCYTDEVYLERSYTGTDGVYSSGGTFEVTITICGTAAGPVVPLVIQELTPPGWIFDHVTDAPSQGFDAAPVYGETEHLVFAWSSLEALPESFSYQLDIPADDTSSHYFSGISEGGLGDGLRSIGTHLASGSSWVLYPHDFLTLPVYPTFYTVPTDCGSFTDVSSYFAFTVESAYPLPTIRFTPVITHDISSPTDMTLYWDSSPPVEESIGGASSPTSGYYEFYDLDEFFENIPQTRILSETCVMILFPDFTSMPAEPCTLLDVSALSSIDDELDARLRTLLSMGPLDDYDPCAMMELTSFTHVGHPEASPPTVISDASGLELFSSLSDVSLANDPITDLTPFAKLRAYPGYLQVANATGLSDLSPLEDYHWAGMWLTLWNSDVSDLTPLSGRFAMRRLDLSGTEIDEDDLTDLAPLTGLQNLNIAGTDVASLDNLESLINLEWLTADSTTITDLTPLADLVNLKYLRLGNSWGTEALDDISPLASLPKLTSLTLQNTLVDDLSPLANAEHLNFVQVVDSGVSSIRPLLDADNMGPGDTLEIYASPLSEECQCEERALMAARGVDVDNFVPSGTTFTCGDEEAFLPRAGSLLHIPVDNGVIEGHDVGPIMSVAYDDAGNVGLAFTDYAMLHVYYIEYGPNGTGGPIELDDPIIETGIDPLSEVLETVRGIYSLDLKFGPSGQAGIAVGVHPEFDDKAVVFYLRTNASNANWTGPETVVDADAPPGADAVDNSFKFSFAAFDFLPTGEPLVAFTTKWGEAGDFGFAVRSSGTPHWTPNFDEDFFGGNEEGGSNATLGNLVYARGNVTLNLFERNGQTEWLAFVGTQREDGLDLFDEIHAVRGNATGFLGKSLAFTTDGGEAFDTLLDDNVGISEIKTFSATIHGDPGIDPTFGPNVPVLAINAYDNSSPSQRDGIYVKDLRTGDTTVAFKQYRSSDVIQLGGMVTTKEQDALLTFVTYPDSPSGDWEGSVYTLDALNVTHDAIDEDFHEVLVDRFYPPTNAWDNDEWRPAIAYSPASHLAAVPVKGHMPGVPTSDSVTHQTAIAELPATGVANFGPHVRFANSFGWLPNSWDTSGTWAQGGSGSAHYEHNSTNGATLGRTVSHGDFRLRFRLKLETGSTEAHVLVRADDQTSPTDFVQFTFSTDGAELGDSDSVDIADNTSTSTYLANLWYQCEIVGSGGSIKAYVGADGSPLALVTPVTSGSPPVEETTAITSGTDIAFTAPGSNQIQVDDVILWVY